MIDDLYEQLKGLRGYSELRRNRDFQLKPAVLRNLNLPTIRLSKFQRVGQL